MFDLHFHMRPQVAANLAHLDGAGVTKANLLTRGTVLGQVKALQAAAPNRFVWFNSVDISMPAAESLLTQAAELKVPMLIHFQEVDHFENEGSWNTGYARRFEGMLKAYPRTTFIGHADAFWANVSADYHNEAAYPSGPIRRGGITDRLLSDYPNLFGDLSANSGNNALSRDATFTADFLKRHQDKLFFGSDCGCSDGHGAGVSQNNNPAAARLAGKCVARETLTVLKRSASPAVFRKLTWDNIHRLLRIPA